MAKKINSPYSAALTGGGFLFEETLKLLPLLKSPDRKKLLKDEALNNRLMMINSETSRNRNIVEIERRFDCMPKTFWNDFEEMAESDRRIALLMVILKTYKIVFDFHINVTIPQWNSVTKTVEQSDLMIEFNEISANDEFVDSWSDATKKKLAGAYLTILRKAGMIGSDGKLCQLKPSNPEYYLHNGEAWFLEACLLAPYQIEAIKKQLS